MATEVVFYREGAEVPALEWLLAQPETVQDKFRFVLNQLRDKGSMLMRPHAAPLADKIYELRVRQQRVNYRLLYFFSGGTAAIVAHGCTKKDVVDRADIRRAVERRQRFLKDPGAHWYKVRCHDE